MSLAACGGSPSRVKVTTAKYAGLPACARAAAHWPSTVSNQTSRKTSVKSPTVKAWGDPPIIARCGVTAPGPNPNCITVNGVDWVVNPLSDGNEMVTFGRSPAIEVLAPKKYSAELLPAFTAAAKAIPQGPHHCT
ncbi:DUF3515 family protein [Leekyejoonella antrihumi]|uniref:DUF3515 family protein n=1 Tax=Leekyejoonella antrihumi TaxID=1660198 RepID=A0A563E1H7_9MICO|nr:DUF3515 family protein [Leekyejoonella antrihumi]